METINGMYSIREIFRIGRGPSSSHTMAPAFACERALAEARGAERFEVTLFGSLAKTGMGHRTDYAIYKTFDKIPVQIFFDMKQENLPHPNTMEITAFCGEQEIYRKRFLSVGGGALREEGKEEELRAAVYPEKNFAEIESYCLQNGLTLSQYALQREGEEICAYMQAVWQRMKQTIANGLEKEGELPGGLHVTRKAKMLLNKGQSKAFGHEKEIYLLSAYAYAASEENAAGEQMVTAPTCGASGVLPAVLLFKQQELGYSEEQIISALLTAGVVGNVIKRNASVSGAECGCQAEIGTACVMAAAAFAALKGLTIRQIECAAEIALEHHLGLTCDPVAGLVQIPCIERNAVAAMRAVDAVSLAEMLYENRKISLDLAVRTMYETGRDLSRRYRETAEGGLAELYPKNGGVL